MIDLWGVVWLLVLCGVVYHLFFEDTKFEKHLKGGKKMKMNVLLEVKSLTAVALADMMLKVDEGKVTHEDRRRLESLIRVYRSASEDLWRIEGGKSNE